MKNTFFKKITQKRYKTIDIYNHICYYNIKINNKQHKNIINQAKVDGSTERESKNTT